MVAFPLAVFLLIITPGPGVLSLADIVDAIGGWTTEGVGHQYGKGHSLSVKARWMHKLTKS